MGLVFGAIIIIGIILFVLVSKNDPYGGGASYDF